MHTRAGAWGQKWGHVEAGDGEVDQSLQLHPAAPDLRNNDSILNSV